MQSTFYSYSLSSSSGNNIDVGISTSSSSSSPSHHSLTPTTHKRRKIERACDCCRRRKTRCDGSKMKNNVCTNCLQTKKSCTYVETSKPRGPPKAYITGLEEKMERLEALLKELRPGVDFSSTLGPPVPRGSWKPPESVAASDEHAQPQQSFIGPSASNPPKAAQSATKFNTTSNTPQTAPLGRSTHLIFDPQPTSIRVRLKAEQPLSGEDTDNESPSSDDSVEPETLRIETVTGLVKKMTLRGADGNTEALANENSRFHGNCSGVGLVEATRQFKAMHLLETTQGSRPGQPPAPLPGKRGRPSGRLPLRPEFWRISHWEHAWEVQHITSANLDLTEFPPADLAEELINLFFSYSNRLIPVLHRTTFVRLWREKLHHKHIWFAVVCLFVFAVASRWTEDPRVIKGDARTPSGDHDWKMAGWGYFLKGIEMHRTKRSIFYPSTLLEIQSLTIMALFLNGTGYHPAAWTIIVIAVRKAQDVGAHRKNVYRSTPTVDGEMWKRTFWCLITLDRMISLNLGRGCGMGEEDFDLDLPLEVDEPYWEIDDPNLAFRQPAGTPAQVSAFIALIKLSQIVAFALRTVYAINQSKVFSGLKFVNWREEVLEQLNTALSEWTASVPDHLAWPPQKDHSSFINEAALLQMVYHLTRIFIYRPFISSTGAAHSTLKNAVPSFPDLAMDICIGAARSCARVVEMLKEGRLANITAMLHVAHVAASILLIKVWNLKAEEKKLQAQGIEDVKPPSVQRIEPLMVDVNIFMRLLEWAEPRWAVVSQFLHQLRESMPYSSDQQMPNVTAGLGYSTNLTPVTPPPQYIIAQQPEAQIAPSNCFWPSSHAQIQPTHSARPPFQAQPPNLYTQYEPDLIAFITQEHRSVKEHYEIQKDDDHASYSAEAVSWQLPTAPASYTSNFTLQTISTAYQGSNEAVNSGNCPSECPNSESTSIPQPAFPMRSDMTINRDNRQSVHHAYKSSPVDLWQTDSFNGGSAECANEARKSYADIWKYI